MAPEDDEQDNYYYRAGVHRGHTWQWSAVTRRSRAQAEREARSMARHAGHAVVEYWRRDHGQTPSSEDAVDGFYYC